MAEPQTRGDIDRTAGALIANDPPRDTSPPDSPDAALGMKTDKTELKDLTSLAKRSASESTDLYNTTKADYKADRARAEEQFKAAQLQEVPKWDAEAEGKKHSTDPITEFASLGSVFGILASAFTHAPMENALNASAAAINAIKAGDNEAYKRAHTAWKENTDLALKRAELERGRFQDAVTLMKTNMEGGMNMIKMHAAETGDKQTAIMAEHGDIEALLKMQESRATVTEKLTKVSAAQQENMMAMDIIQDFRAKEIEKFKEAHGGREPVDVEKAPLKAAADKKYMEYLSNLKRNEHTYGSGGTLTNDRTINRDADQRKQRQRDEHPDWDEDKLNAERDAYVRSRQIATAKPSGNRVDDLRGKIDQTDNIIKLSDKSINFLEKYKGGAGLMGKLMRGEEIAENIVGAGTKSDRVQFRRWILELQEIVPRILTDSNGRPLASAQEKVDGLVAGIAAGDTSPNSIRALRELVSDIKKRQQDYRGRLEGGYDPSKASSGAGRDGTTLSAKEGDADAKTQPWLRDKKVGQ